MRGDVQLATPRMMEVRGGWMVVSAPGSRIKIGAAPGVTKDQAMRHWDDAIRAWQRLVEPARNS